MKVGVGNFLAFGRFFGRLWRACLPMPAKRNEYLYQACLCSEDTCFVPESCAALCGSYSDSLDPCFVTRNKYCIMSGHEHYETLVKQRKDVICTSTGSSYLVKPMCLSGAKPCCVQTQSQCCFSSRLAFPPKEEVISKRRLAYYGLQCFENGLPSIKCCTTEVKPMDSKVFEGEHIPYHKVKVSEEYIIFGCCCCMMTMFIPATFMDAMGSEHMERSCCCEYDSKGGLAPDSIDGFEILIKSVWSSSCVSPTTCCKGVDRRGFTIVKYAFPPDKEVPCSIAFCGLVCCGTGSHFKSPAPFAAPPKKKGPEGFDDALSGGPESSHMER